MVKCIKKHFRYYYIYVEEDTWELYISTEDIKNKMQYKSLRPIYSLVRELCNVLGIKQKDFVKKHKLIKLDHAIAMLARSSKKIKYKVILDLVKIERESKEALK